MKSKKKTVGWDQPWRGLTEGGSPKTPTRELKQSAMELSNSFKVLKKCAFWPKKMFWNLMQWLLTLMLHKKHYLIVQKQQADLISYKHLFFSPYSFSLIQSVCSPVHCVCACTRVCVHACVRARRGHQNSWTSASSWTRGQQSPH